MLGVADIRVQRGVIELMLWRGEMQGLKALEEAITRQPRRDLEIIQEKVFVSIDT